MVYVIEEDGAMGSRKGQKTENFYREYESEMALVTDTKGGGTGNKIMKELRIIQTELEKQQRAASPEMVLRPRDLSPDGASEGKPSKPPEHWSCFDKCFSCCFYGCFLPDTF